MSHSNIAGPAPAPQVSTYDQLPAEYKPTQGHGPVPKLTYRSFAHKAENSSNEYENGVGAGSYAAMMAGIGNFFGFWGSIPFCFCCPSPYKSIQQGTVGIISRFGKYSHTVDPGLHYVNMGTESISICDIKMQLTKVPRQIGVTRDNVTVDIDSVLYWHIIDPFCATFMVEQIENAIMERTMTTLRQVIGTHTLQDAISNRDSIADEIERVIAPVAASWGARIESILIKDIQFSQDLQENLSAAAKQKRLAESKVIAAQGEVDAAKLMRLASDMLNTPAAMQIRYLETLKSMAGSPNTKVIFMPPNGDATNDALATATGGARGGKGNNGGGKPLSDAERLAVTNLVSAM